MNRDEEHLKLLTIFHYVVAGLTALFSLFPVIHLCLGLVFIFAANSLPVKPGETPPPAWFGWIFVIMASIFILVGLTVATCIFMAGRCLSRRKRYNFCFVMACVECMFMPFGTVLGIFSIITLNRESVKQLFK